MVEKVKVKRILHIVSALELGGAETLIMNVYRNIDRNKIQFDFVTHSDNKGDLEEEVECLGGRIYRIPSLGQLGAFAYVKRLLEVMKTYPYWAIHSHTDFQGGFPALAAKIIGIENRICHSHSTNWNKGSNVKDKMILSFLKFLIRLSASNYCSCSIEAAQFLFGERVVAKGKASVLNNGIDVDVFNYSSESRERFLKEHHLKKDTKLIGHIGRFSESKNHRFLLAVVKQLVAIDDRFVAVLVGDGPQKDQIIQEAEKLGIRNNCIFLGIRKDIPRLMNTFDVFLFPSLFEGFGIVTIEAQCAGTPCVISDTVPKETDMGLGLATYVSLDSSKDVWCEEIMKLLSLEKPNSNAVKKQIIRKGFSIKENIKEWLRLYGLETV